MEPAVAPSPKMIRQKPPHVPKQVRSWKGRNAMPGDPVEVHILDAVAVDVDFVITGQALDAFGDAAFGAMTLINKRGDNGDAWSGHEEARRYGLTCIISHQRWSTNKLQIRDQPTEASDRS